MERQGIVNFRSDTLCGEMGLEFVAAGATDCVLVEDMPRLIGGDSRQANGRIHFAEQAGVAGGVALPGFGPSIEELHFDLQDGGLQRVDTRIDADKLVDVLGASAVEAGLGENAGQRGVVGRDHAAVAPAAEVLAGIETEAAHGADGAAAAAFVLGADGLGRVLYDDGAMTGSNLEEGVHVGGAAKQMHGLDGPNVPMAPQGILDLIGVEVHGEGVDIDEDGFDADAGERAGGREERVGSGDDLVAWPQLERHPGKQEGVAAGGAADGVAGLCVASDLTLELTHGRAHDEALRVDEGKDFREHLLTDGGMLRYQIEQRHLPGCRCHAADPMIASSKIEEVEQSGLQWQPWQPEKLTVRQLTSRIRRALRDNFANLTVTGEVSGLKAAASGHLYFNLKEEDTVLPCAMYRQSARFLRTPLRDGQMIEARGSVDVYEPRGAYQFLVESAQPLGAGALQQAFEELKQRLAAEGLFDAARKRPLPSFPRRIGIITSPGGAVIQDMLNVLSRRCPGLHIRIYPALVQGAGSAEQLVAGLEWFRNHAWADVVVLARGGGSLEDLWSFNDEALARAIAACPVPVVSAVGHETDFTIADFAADLRAPTPSAAAELIVPDMQAVGDRLAALERALSRNVRHCLSSRREQLFRQGIDHARLLLHRRLNRLGQGLDDVDAALAEALSGRLGGLREQLQQQTLALFRLDRRKLFAARREELGRLDARMSACIQVQLGRAQRRHDSLDGQLRQMNPLKILARGFAVVTDGEGRLVSTVSGVSPRDRLSVRVSDGSFPAQVLKGK